MSCANGDLLTSVPPRLVTMRCHSRALSRQRFRSHGERTTRHDSYQLAPSPVHRLMRAASSFRGSLTQLRHLLSFWKIPGAARLHAAVRILFDDSGEPFHPLVGVIE